VKRHSLVTADICTTFGKIFVLLLLISPWKIMGATLEKVSPLLFAILVAGSRPASSCNGFFI